MQESNFIPATTIRAGDTVLHKPSSETWHVCGVHKDGTELIPSGYPFPSIAKVVDCMLIEQSTKPQTEEDRKALMKCGMLSFLEPQLTYRGDGMTTIIQKEPVSKIEAEYLATYISATYQLITPIELCQLYPNGNYCLKVLLQGFYDIEPDNMFFNILHAQFYIGQTNTKKEKKQMNPYEKQGTLHEAIQDAERRLGSYLAMDGCEKTDAYAQQQITRIRDWSEQLDRMYNKEVTYDASN